MKQVDFYLWMVPQQPPKKSYQTSWHMSLEEGYARFPNGKPVLSSKETRNVPENDQERGFLGHSNGSNAPKVGPVE
jgi:hypothetical protein